MGTTSSLAAHREAQQRQQQSRRLSQKPYWLYMGGRFAGGFKTPDEALGAAEDFSTNLEALRSCRVVFADAPLRTAGSDLPSAA